MYRIHYRLLVATVGVEADCWLKEKHACGDLVESFVADAIGSALSESIMAYALNLLEEENRQRGYGITNPYSPGYCSWPVSDQHTLFSLLPTGFCGITQTQV
ncbi:MAG: hypothetical protein LUD74_05940 [Tannerellaceae bacterium]|nr:hypothetical protein [Tannerellaceae bacterium]